MFANAFEVQVTNTLAALKASENFGAEETEQVLQLLATLFHDNHAAPPRTIAIEDDLSSSGFAAQQALIDGMFDRAYDVVRNNSAGGLLLTQAETIMELASWHIDASKQLYESYPLASWDMEPNSRQVFQRIGIALNNATRLIYQTYPMSVEVNSEAAARIATIHQRASSLNAQADWLRDMPAHEALHAMKMMEDLASREEPNVENFRRVADLLRSKVGSTNKE